MNWKEKVVAFSMLLGLLALAVFITPQTHAACYFKCVSESCYYPQGLRGHWAIGETNGQDEVVVYGPYCQGFSGNQLFQGCSWFFCGSNGAGVYFNVDGDKVDVFAVRNKEDEKQIVAVINKDGLSKAVQAYHAMQVPAEKFNDWKVGYLAANDPNHGKGCPVNGK